MAKKNGWDEELTLHLFDFYWKRVRNHLTSLEYPNVYLHGIGTLTAKPTKVPYLIEKYERIITYYNKLILRNKISIQQFTIYKESEASLAKLKKLQVKMIKIKELKIKTKTAYYAHKYPKQDQNDLEKP